MLSSVFNITNITVTNNNKISEQEIISLSGLTKNENMFKVLNKKVEESIEQNPYYPYSYLNYAVMYREKEDFKRAIEIINEGIAENEDEGFLYYNRACFYVGVNKLDLALEDVLKAIELNDFFEDYMKEDEELNDIRTLEKYKKNKSVLKTKPSKRLDNYKIQMQLYYSKSG